MEQNIYAGHGNSEMYDDYIDFINYVFGMNGEDGGFISLCPKLYKREYSPCESNYVIMDGVRFKSAIGAFDSTLNAAGISIRRRGIGNVAVHPFARGAGYMKTLMKMAVDDMIKDGIDISDLGGRRQRYGWFSYERGGAGRSFNITGDNFRYVFGKTMPEKLTVKKVCAADVDILDLIYALYNTRALRMERCREKLYDILNNWRAEVNAYFCGTQFIGYTVSGGSTINEVSVTDTDKFIPLLYSFMRSRSTDSIEVMIPLWQNRLAAEIYHLAESITPEDGEMYTVFNFKKVVSAFLGLKATYEPLADGELTVLVHGIARDEKFRITVKKGIPDVSCFDGEPMLEIEHKRAVSFFFGLYSPEREMLGGAEKSWLPLPIFISSPDAV